KLPPGDLDRALCGIEFPTNSNVLVGLDRADDAGVYKVTDEIAMIQTVDFFTPIVDDPYWFGQIAAANALSDVYAMGGRPLTAMNIVCYPSRTVPREVLQAILAGGLDKIHEAGALLLGGHSVDDTELKYGLSVTGVVHPERVLTNAGAQAGDILILTKPLGTGIIATAMKGRLATPAAAAAAAQVMTTLNRLPPECLEGRGVHAVTDITGFGLFGHALEMAMGSRVKFTIYAHKVPVLTAAREYAAMGLVPAGSLANRNYCSKSLLLASELDPVLVNIFSDAQTNGGLLLAVAPAQAALVLEQLHNAEINAATVIGEVRGTGTGQILVKS
ncbi:MAG: selenide, water dikinase SelD, partial [Proteobacteria bacterium]|nr:selenide, water dikinase SelD [Pseudomonadota bacterium]